MGGGRRNVLVTTFFAVYDIARPGVEAFITSGRFFRDPFSLDGMVERAFQHPAFDLSVGGWKDAVLPGNVRHRPTLFFSMFDLIS